MDLKYYKRKVEEASTSNYIQTITTDKDGAKKTQDRLSETPDAKIIIPQMKADINEIQKLNPSLMLEDAKAQAKSAIVAAIMKMMTNSKDKIMSLLPQKSKTTVKETKPTGEKAEYGKIQVKENKAGFVEIRDETTGNVRKVDLHPTGTYTTMLDNGDQEDKTTGKKLTIVDKNWEIVVFENEIVVINKDSKIHIKENSFLTINGNQDIHVDKDSCELIKGERKFNVKKNEMQKIEGNQNIGVDGNQKEQVNGNVDVNISGKKKEQVGNSKTEIIGSNLQIIVSGNCNISANGPVKVSSSKQVSITAPKISLG